MYHFHEVDLGQFDFHSVLLKLDSLLMSLNCFLSFLLALRSYLGKIGLKLSKAIVSECIQSFSLMSYFLSPLEYCLLQLIDFLHDLGLHVRQMLVVLLLRCLDLEHGLSMLLLHILQAVLQMHNLFHVIVLGKCIVFLGQSFII